MRAELGNVRDSRRGVLVWKRGERAGRGSRARNMLYLGPGSMVSIPERVMPMRQREWCGTCDACADARSMIELHGDDPAAWERNGDCGASNGGVLEPEESGEAVVLPDNHSKSDRRGVPRWMEFSGFAGVARRLPNQQWSHGRTARGRCQNAGELGRDGGQRAFEFVGDDGGPIPNGSRWRPWWRRCARN